MTHLFWTSRRLLAPRLMSFLKANYLVMAWVETGKTLRWIDSFLCYRTQRAVVNGETSEWAPILSGVPQGTVLGPLLFSLYINNISTDMGSEIRLFVDDCVCYRKSETQTTH